MRIRSTPQSIHSHSLDLEHADLWLLRRYWRREASSQEIVQVERWLAGHPDRQATYDALRCGLADTTRVHLSDTDRIARTTTILNAAVQRTAPPPPVYSRHNRPVSRRWAAVATLASLLVSLAAGWLLHAHRMNARLSTRHYTYTTSNGEQATVKLPDGTTVLLNVASRLDVPSDFATGHRTVRLTGEAVFTVVHHSDAPFTVIAGPSTTRVLGTSFVVRHYAADTAALIAVRDGKVDVASVILAANQEVMVSPHAVNAVQRTDSSRFSLESGVLTLKSMLLTSAITELNRWYDVEIRMADPRLGMTMIDGQFGKGSQSDLANQLSLGLHAKVVREGRVLTLYPNGGTR